MRKKLGLKKRYTLSSDDLREIVNNELATSNKKVGYRQMAEFINLKSDIVFLKNA